MFFNSPPRQQGILKVSDNFARLKLISGPTSDSNSVDPSSQVSNNELHFIFIYQISQIKALEENALNVEITVKSKNKNKSSLIDDFQNKRELTEKILTNRTRIANSDSGTVIIKTDSDITSRINNQLIQGIKNNSELEDLGIRKNKLMLRTIKHVKENDLTNNVLQPISGFFNRDLGFSVQGNFTRGELYRSSVQTLFHGLMNRGIPPSKVATSNSRYSSSFETSQGLIKKNLKEEYENDPSIEILNLYLYDSQENPKSIFERSEQEVVTTIENVVDTFVTIKKLVKIPLRVVKSDPQLIVKFDLIKTDLKDSGTRNSYILESVEKSININDYVDKYYKVFKPPFVGKFSNESNITLSFQQVDERANLVEVYKKTINENEYSSFTKIDEISLTKSNGVLVRSYDNMKDQHAIFRVIAKSSFDKKIKNYEFNDAIVTNKFNPPCLVTLIPELVPEGIKVTAYNRNPNIKIARLLARNTTLRHSNFVETSNVFYFSETVTEQSVILRNLKENHIYEFTTKVVYRSGEENFSSQIAIIEMMRHEGNALKVTINNSGGQGQTGVASSIVASNGGFSFSCQAALQRDQVGQAESAIATTSALYNVANLKNSETTFDKFIFFMITRYNITNGEVANLGIVGNGEMVIDSQQSKKFLAEELISGNEYVYVIQPLVRDPETVISEIKNVREKETRKEYQFDPKKHRHPLTIKKGMMLSKDFLDFDPTHFGLYGKVGINYTLKIKKKKLSVDVVNPSAEVDGSVCKISWGVKGDVSDVDHFVIAKVNENLRKIIGKAHCINSENIHFIHELTKEDVGSNHYIIIPILSNFEVGSSLKTNEVLIEEIDVMDN